MKLYGISGLGADERVYKGLSLNCEFVFLEWIKPFTGEPLSEYASRLASRIDTSEEFGLVGVSFGGLVAIEIAKIIKPKYIILISSIETSSELSTFYKYFGKTQLSRILPVRMFAMPKQVAGFLFGTKSPLLNQILRGIDLNFTKWAVNELVYWESKEKIENVYRIHGMNDRLLKSPKEGEGYFLIKNGSHFIVVDEANKVSELINLIILSN